jgi:hypothetical protein
MSYRSRCDGAQSSGPMIRVPTTATPRGRFDRVALAAAVIALLATSPGFAADKSYMTLVAELVNIVETPRYLQEACGHRLPDRRAALLAEYQAWRKRHSGLLAAIAVQIDKANARAKRQGASVSITDLSAAGAQVMRDKMDSVGKAQAREICGEYSEILRDKDASMANVVPRRLAAIEEADRQLTASEQQP